MAAPARLGLAAASLTAMVTATVLAWTGLYIP
jgi:hypothetical protein